MTEPTRPTGLEQFDQAWLAAIEEVPFPRLIFGLVGLTRLGESPAPIERLAAILDRPTEETAALVREETTARIEDGLIHWDTPFPVDRARRTLYVGDREIPMNGCVPDLFGFATVLDVPFRVEDTCAATGVPIRVDFVPGGYERADPPEAVTVMLSPQALSGLGHMNGEQIDDNVCVQQPFFASVEAAEGWLAGHPGGRTFTVKEMFERLWVTYYRDNLRPLIHPASH